MYTDFFGLQQAPFSIAPDPRFLFMSLRHREALAHLVYGLQAGGGFVLLTGDIGSGKTTVCRSLLQQTPPTVELAYIFNPRLDALELLQGICEEFGVELPPAPHSVKSLTAALNGFLLRAHAAGQRCVLIIDEAQSLSTEVLEQLRLLTNLETDEHKLLQIMLIGQPELRDLLAQPALEQLAQRVIARYHLQALDLPDTRQYIEHRLRVAGLDGPVPFSDAATRRVHQLSGGVPRRINLLCDRALLGAYAQRQSRVDPQLVDLAATEVMGQAPAGRALPPARWATVSIVMAVALVLGWWFGSAQVSPAVPTASPAPSHPAQTHRALAASTAAPASPSVPVAVMPALKQLPDGENPLWQTLGKAWRLQLPDSDICSAALQQGVQCFRTSGLSPAKLQQLDRPGLLLLRGPDASRWVMVTGLRDGLWQLQAGTQQWTLPQAELVRWWRGDYASLWRLPPGQHERVFAATPQDAAGRWLNGQLIRLQQGGQLPAAASDFAARVRAFQQQHGLHGDGKALPSTFLLANRLAGVDEPRLQP